MCPVLLFPEEGIELLKEMFMRDSIVIMGGVRQFGAEYITGGNPVW